MLFKESCSYSVIKTGKGIDAVWTCANTNKKEPFKCTVHLYFSQTRDTQFVHPEEEEEEEETKKALINKKNYV